MQSEIAESVAHYDGLLETKECIEIANARGNNIEAKVNEEKLHSAAFQALWTQINAKSAYAVRFDEAELVNKAITALNTLNVPQIFIQDS